MKKTGDMTMQELHDHTLSHPDHKGPAQIALLGMSFAKRWHFGQHTVKKLNHDHQGDDE